MQFLIALIGLGVAIDYSLLLVSRWREERAHGHANEEAVVIAMKTAGHAVLASGVTVAISLLALVVVPVPFLRSMGIGGMLIPLVSVAVVLTLLPALLSKIGPRVDWPADPARRAGPSRGLDGLGPAHRPAPVASPPARRWSCLALLDHPGVQPQDRPGQRRLAGQSGAAVRRPAGTSSDGGVGTGVLTPLAVLVPPDQADAAADAAREVDGIQMAVVGGDAGDTAVVDVAARSRRPWTARATRSSTTVRDCGRGRRRRRGRRDRRRRRPSRTTSARSTTSSRTCWP